ncbi:MAG: 4Fe-4S binding protein [Armatimonadota bacterium]|jgi:ferredoxin-type protein NapH
MAGCASGRCEIEASQRGKRTLRWVMGAFLVALIGAGWMVPWFGYFVPVCMIGGLVPAFFLGRKWCDWTCWRGSFLESIVGAIAGGRPVPKLLRSTGFRVGVMALLFTMFGLRITQLWGDWVALGGFFVIFLTATTVVAIVLGIIYQPRGWCAFCPLGTLASWAGGGKKPLQISDACVGCGLCTKACAMDIDIPSYARQGVVSHGDCIKCGACIAACPVGALSFDGEDRRAA